ncbi:MAG: carbonic anhydrase, partial [Alphaproteobacteria bacterium]|nr:carbonic anhydrase [Alphaproteobacteria bacterium]
LEPARQRTAHVHDGGARHTEMERHAVRLSLERLMTFPFVAERVRAGSLALHGARFGIAEGQLELLESETGAFQRIE